MSFIHMQYMGDVMHKPDLGKRGKIYIPNLCYGAAIQIRHSLNLGQHTMVSHRFGCWKKYAKREYKYVICDLDLFCRNLLYRRSMNQKGKRGNKFSLIWYHLEILLRSGSHCTIYTLCGGSMTCLGKYIPYHWYWTARQISLIHPLNLA